MKTWDELMKESRNAREAMRDLGDCGPTARVTDKEVKGYCRNEDGDGTSFYMSSEDLRSIARGMHEVADWLDERAKADPCA